MSLRLPRLPQTPPSHSELQIWWQQVVEAVESHEGQQDVLITGLAAVVAEQAAIIARIRRINSHTSPTTILTAEDDGATATITVSDHVRVYGDGTTLSITGGAQSGLTSDTPYGIHYDDTTLADTTPAFVFTTTIADAQAAAGAGRHFLGVIRTPPAGSGQTREGGGAYPVGSSIGGEV